MSAKPYIIAIDDDQFYLNEAELELAGKAQFRGFLGPNDFEELIDEQELAKADAILVDYEFAGGSAIQSGIADLIRNHLGYKGKVILWTLHPRFSEQDQKQIDVEYDAVIRKSEFSWQRLTSLLGEKVTAHG